MSRFHITIITILTVLIVATIFITLIREQQYIDEIDRITSEYASSQESHLEATTEMIKNYNILYSKYLSLHQSYKELGKQKGFSDGWDTYVVSAYTSNDSGCNEYSAIGMNIERWSAYFSFVAVDPNVIPLGAVVLIKDGEDIIPALAVDTGGAIKGNRLDLYHVNDRDKAFEWGMRELEVKIIY